ncbi:MAG: alpha/beta hydrolase family protein [Vicinamibacterales bacterium]
MGSPRGGVRASGLALLVAASLATATMAAQNNRIDGITPSAPELAAPGPHAVGVRTLSAVDRNRPDVLHTTPGGPTARYDRAYTLEVWYPAVLTTGQRAEGEYRAVTRDPSVVVTLRGRAVRDARPLAGGPWPLVILSHGYPGNRHLMSHLGEHLATRGYVVASIDHPESTYDDLKGFASTLYNRAFDQLFVLNELARNGRTGSGSPLAGLVDADRTAIVGYSMGGYGVVNVVGGAYREAAAAFPAAPPNGLLRERSAADPAYATSIDRRVKAAIAIGPWGMHTGYWDSAGLAGIRTPVLFVAGSVDDVSGYEKGTRALFDGAVNAERYLLTFLNANHNAAAPIPAPAETYTFSARQQSFPFVHYADAVWDTVRMNNILQHFATAFADLHLKGDGTRREYLDVVANGRDGVFALAADGTPRPEHTYWKGFKRGTAVGLTLEHRPAAAQ